MKRLGFFLCPAALCLALASPAQTQAQSRQEALEGYYEEYVRTEGYNAALFNGRIQNILPGNIESLYLRDRGYVHRNEFGEKIFPRAVAIAESYAVGDIFYNGVLYVGIRMRLDLYRDELVVTPPGDALYGPVIDPARLGYADLRGYRVIHVPDPPSSFDLPGGYYLRLHEGRHDVLKKESFDFHFSRREFLNRSLKYYVEKDGIYHSVGRKKGAVLRVFSDRRGELKRFIRAEKLRMRGDTENALVEIVSEYERLTDR